MQLLDDLILIVNNRHVLFLRNVERSGYEADVEDEGEEDEAQESPDPFSYPDLMDLDDGWMDDGGQDVDLTVERLSEPSVSLQNLHDLHNRLLFASSHSPVVHSPTPSPSVQPIPTSRTISADCIWIYSFGYLADFLISFFFSF